ncbi:DUF6308 family protein [Actinomycetospora sp. OC33-EN08]|uniref:DUF6308 family protein n=1 Tax=Actinomycetospora aurantiaca TaxID=3129233 RepID=A0ABU8MH01_9PSEU
MPIDRLDWFEEAAVSGPRRDECVRNLRAYFAGTDGIPAYSGSRFESFGDNPWNRIVVDDLVAVSMLSVRVPGQAALRFLERSAGAISALLVQIPTDLDLYEESAAEHVAAGSAADQLWTLLRTSSQRHDGVGTGLVTTSKLLARKRPRLLPVWDGVVAGQLGLAKPRTHWEDVHRWLADDRRVEILRSLEAEGHVPAHVSLLRVLDVVLWMRGEDEQSVREQQNPDSD